MAGLTHKEEQGIIWDYFKPRHTHSWNMLVLSWRDLNSHNREIRDDESGFEVEYSWENFILRLWLYRTTVKTLTKLTAIKIEAEGVIHAFDAAFDVRGRNGLKAIRDIIEHFDDYAVGLGRGPAKRENDLDPWRLITADRYERGDFLLERNQSYDAAIKMRSDARNVGDKFIQWYNSPK
ncbi:MAG: hypothetical protein WAW54_03810 [Parvibaculum sedimenti]|uniref:hypothetical protein n=1 Tax=Parvibaculum sedimenti TaxID=2608632 RepID=UPI003BB4A8EB